MAISACFRGVATSVNNYMDNNPRVRRLTQVVALLAAAALLGTSAGLGFKAMGLAFSYSLILGSSIGISVFYIGMFLLIAREDARRRRQAPAFIPAAPARILAAPAGIPAAPAPIRALPRENERQPLLYQKNNQGSRT